MIGADAIRRVLDSFEERPVRRVVLDLGGARNLTSATLGALLDLNKRLPARRAKFTLRGVHPDIREVFRITRLDQVFEIEA